MEGPGGVGDGQQPHLTEAVTTAAITGNMHKVRQMVDRHHWLLHASDAYGRTVLRAACMRVLVRW